MSNQHSRFLALCAVLAASFIGVSAFAAEKAVDAAGRNAALLTRLVDAYPDFLAGHDGLSLIWKDGTKMPFDDGRTGKDFEALLNKPDLEDQFYTPYPLGRTGLAPAKDIDPGRVRFEPFFKKMYGDCRAGGVKAKLKTIVWLPKHDGRKISVTGVNKVDERLKAVSKELDVLIDKRPEMKLYLAPSAGTYNCRLISGTKRFSVHSFGAAIDIATAKSHYWRWAKPGVDGLYPWRNAIPLEIVEIFERHGFIWGGKWYHYDTMHFEYRPEILGMKG